MSEESRICPNCIFDTQVQKNISNSDITNLECEYCGSIGPSIGIDELADMCAQVIDSFYDVSSLTNAVIHFDRTPEGEPISDLLHRIISTHNSVIENLIQILTEVWFDRDIMESIYGDDPWFVGKKTYGTLLEYEWNSMRESLQTEARYVNPKATEILENVFGQILKDETFSGEPVVVTVGKHHRNNIVYRARVFQSTHELEEALQHPELHLGPPPNGLGSSGRMNARGVSVFYGATDKQIAVAEVRPPVGGYVVVASFTVIKDLRLLDLTLMDELQLIPDTSPFDANTVQEANRRGFIKILSKKMVIPVMPNSEEQDYIVTQAIADFLATHPSLNLDGIIFNSAQQRSSTQPKGRNVVLFKKSSTVQGSAFNSNRKISVRLWRHKDENSFFSPNLHIAKTANENSEHKNWNNVEPTLALNIGTIEIRRITSVSFESQNDIISISGSR